MHKASPKHSDFCGEEKNEEKKNRRYRIYQIFIISDLFVEIKHAAEKNI